jgi:hypothetical protein
MNRHDYLVQRTWLSGVKRPFLAFKRRFITIYGAIFDIMWPFLVIHTGGNAAICSIGSVGESGYIYGCVDGARGDQRYNNCG